ncbi:hypothetical protein [Oligoflexus tunisiensis]|uniref:hypothetical protein n=1 Tax=Oligoflexus tunisiensis TaxID=708132 RepID=UPI00114CA8AD|nr:hypothetical protein [Oligoflexus tunisiensis]
MRVPALLFSLWLVVPSVQARSRTAAAAEYGPGQVLAALRELREQRGDPSPPKLSVCLKSSSGGQWSDLQAHFYCWLKPDQRACFTGAVDGEFKDHPELKGNYDRAFTHCQEAKGRAYGINFDRPMARLTAEQAEVFKNVLYRQPMFSKDDQRKILEAFYASAAPERKSFPAPAPEPTPPPPAMSMSATLVNPDMGDIENATPEAGYPKTCQVKSAHARALQKPDSKSPIVAILDPTTIQVTGPAQASSGTDVQQWYPVEFPHKGRLVKAWLTVSLVNCRM